MIKVSSRAAARVAIAALGVASASQSSATVWVANSTNIVATFAKLVDGDTLKLTGAFGLTRLSNRSFATGITIDGSRAKFLDTLVLKNLDNVKMINTRFDTRGSATAFGRALVVYDGSNIVFNHLGFIGDGNQTGLSFAGTNNVTVSNNTFDGLLRGVNVGRVDGGLVTGNKVYRSVSDGIDIGNSHNVVATHNTCTLGAPGPGVHPDCIQLFSAVGNPIQSDIVVSDNYAYGPTQGFTSFATGGGGLRISFLRNRVISSYSQGVACYDCYDSNISYNNVATIPGSVYQTNINVVGGANNTVFGNYIKPPIGLTKTPDLLLGPSAALDLQPVDPIPGTEDLSLATAGSPSGVPEPAGWALLLAGFATIGTVLRRRGSRVVAA